MRELQYVKKTTKIKYTHTIVSTTADEAQPAAKRFGFLVNDMSSPGYVMCVQRSRNHGPSRQGTRVTATYKNPRCLARLGDRCGNLEVLHEVFQIVDALLQSEELKALHGEIIVRVRQAKEATKVLSADVRKCVNGRLTGALTRVGA